MALEFWYGSGSPFSWRVWLALEHKQVPYTGHLISFSARDHYKPEFLARNPRHQVPVISDDGFDLYESNAIVEYLEERYPQGPTLLPGDTRARASIRRTIYEIDAYLMPAYLRVTRELYGKAAGEWDLTALATARKDLLAEATHFDRQLEHAWLSGDRISAADFALAPLIASFVRMDLKKPDFAIVADRPPRIAAWFERFRALPIFEKTYPPHWRA